MEVPQLFYLVFFCGNAKIPRRSWLVWNWTAHIFTTVWGVPPPPIEVFISLLQWFYTPFQGLLSCYDFQTGVLFSFSGEYLFTNPSLWPFDSTVRAILILAILYFFVSFKLSVARNRNSKKVARPGGPFHEELAPFRGVIWWNSVPCGNCEARPDTPKCVGLGHSCPQIFIGIGASWPFFWHSAAQRRLINDLLPFRGEDGSHCSGPPGCPCFHAITYGKFGWPGQQVCFHHDILFRRCFVIARFAPRQAWLAMRSGRTRSMLALFRSASLSAMSQPWCCIRGSHFRDVGSY